MKFLNLCYFLRVIFALLDPDPANQNQSGSETLYYSRKKKHMGISAFLFVLRTLLAVEQLVGQHDVEVLPDPRCHLQDGLLLVVLARRF